MKQKVKLKCEKNGIDEGWFQSNTLELHVSKKSTQNDVIQQSCEFSRIHTLTHTFKIIIINYTYFHHGIMAAKHTISTLIFIFVSAKCVQCTLYTPYAYINYTYFVSSIWFKFKRMIKDYFIYIWRSVWVHGRNGTTTTTTKSSETAKNCKNSSNANWYGGGSAQARKKMIHGNRWFLM